jgi:hypothetical protein
MERMFGVPLFIPTLSDFAHSAAFVPMSGDIDAIWRALEAVQRPACENPTSKLNVAQLVTPSSEATTVAPSRIQRRLLGVALLGVAVGVAFTVPSYLIFALIAGCFGLRLFAKPQASHDFERRYREIETRWLRAEQSWKNRAGPVGFDTLRSELAAFRTEYEGLAAEEQRRIKEYQANRRSEQIAHLP